LNARPDRRRRCAPILPLAALLAFGVGCDENGTEPDPDPMGATGTVILNFDAAVDGEPMEYGQGHDGYVNAAGNVYWVSNLEYTVSDFSMELTSHDAARGAERFETGPETMHYRTHSDPATRSFTLEDVPVGSYSHLHFRFGLDGSVNVDGAFPDLELAMGWPPPLGDGYHYMRHEGNFEAASGDTIGYTTHTGPTQGTDFSFEVSLHLDENSAGARHGFEVVADETVTVTLEMNVNEWYATPNTYSFDDHGIIMPDPGAQSLLMVNGSQEHGSTLWSVKAPE